MTKQCTQCKGWEVELKKLNTGVDVFRCKRCLNVMPFKEENATGKKD